MKFTYRERILPHLIQMSMNQAHFGPYRYTGYLKGPKPMTFMFEGMARKL